MKKGVKSEKARIKREYRWLTIIGVLNTGGGWSDVSDACGWHNRQQACDYLHKYGAELVRKLGVLPYSSKMPRMFHKFMTPMK